MLVSEKGRGLAARMPRERVLTESDGPFAQLHGNPVMPWQVENALQALSQIWSLPSAEVENNIRRNLKNQLAKDSLEREILAASF